MEMGAPHARYAVFERRKAADPWQVTFRIVPYDWNARRGPRRRKRAAHDWAHCLRDGIRLSESN